MMLNLPEAETLLKKYGINVVDEKLVRNRNAAITIAGQIGLPVTVKAHEFVNKTEHNAIKTRINSLEGVSEAFESIKTVQRLKTGKEPGAVLLQKHVEGLEFAITANGLDKTIRFGLGGVFTEIFNDFSSHPLPLDSASARSMVSGLKNNKIFDGFKGFRPVKKEKLAKVLLAIAEMVQRENIATLEINPLFVDGDSVLVADAMITAGDD